MPKIIHGVQLVRTNRSSGCVLLFGALIWSALAANTGCSGQSDPSAPNATAPSGVAGPRAADQSQAARMEERLAEIERRLTTLELAVKHHDQAAEHHGGGAAATSPHDHGGMGHAGPGMGTPGAAPAPMMDDKMPPPEKKPMGGGMGDM